MFTRCLVLAARRTALLSRPITRQHTHSKIVITRTPVRLFSASTLRQMPGGTAADDVVEELTEQYATAKDEFEIAMEETEKMTVYAEDDRKAAREELDKLNEMYTNIIAGPDKELAEEIKRRVGGRIRELQTAIENMEEMAMNQD